MNRTSQPSLFVSVLRASLLTGIAAGVLVGHVAVAEDKLSKFLLIKLSREQSQAMCSSDAFNSCMGFSAEACLELSEEALKQCILPLPDTINLSELNNEALEACPQKVYKDAGFSEEKAEACLKSLFDE